MSAKPCRRCGKRSYAINAVCRTCQNEERDRKAREQESEYGIDPSLRRVVVRGIVRWVRDAA